MLNSYQRKHEEKQHLSICVITHPFSSLSGRRILSNFLDVAKPSCDSLYVITGLSLENRPKRGVEIIRVRTRKGRVVGIRYFLAQLRMIVALLRISKDIDLVLFFVGGDTLLLPQIFARLLRKKTVTIMASSASRLMTPARGVLGKKLDLFAHLAKAIEKLSLMFSQEIILYSKNLAREFNLIDSAHKITIAFEHFVDTEIFDLNSPIESRSSIIGYIGRFSAEKGILNFVEAASILATKRSNITFLVVGEGELKERVAEFVHTGFLEGKIEVLDWIMEKETLCAVLNELKLLVIPSYTEGLPNILLEAMACGTPVLATSVGAIPDIINNNVNGFIMRSNNPDAIASRIIQILEFGDLSKIGMNARKDVCRRFSYAKAIARFERILSA